MKKNLLILFVSLLTFNTLFAQITITQADMPFQNMMAIIAHDTVTAPAPGSSGASQTWNFASLLNHQQDTLFFINPTGTPGATSFPAANLATLDANGYNYLNSSSASLDILGQYTDVGFGPMSFVLTPPQTFISLPSTYNTTFNGTSNFSLTIAYSSPPIDSGRLKHTVTYSSIIDGWGTLSTPTGSRSVIRQKYTQVSYDSIYLHSTLPFPIWTLASTSTSADINYNFWANGSFYPELEITTDTNGVNTGTDYLIASVVGITPVSAKENYIFAFPNPASDQISFSSPLLRNSTLEIFDAHGRKVKEWNEKNNLAEIDTKEFLPGFYFYSVTDNQSGNRLSGKFVVTK
ncbi:MAG: T9SS type A sorting domain-containing protein [Bacteroidia bacterium]|nr:T9SS type A sorting domain-containing protein [Bacteroidia bacterium]